MRILPIQYYVHQPKTTFKGHFKYLSDSWNSGVLTDTEPTSKVYTDSTEAIKSTVNYNMNHFATVQRTVEDFHSVHTGKVYIADPLEFVTDDKRMEADYIVYDNEPPYPEVHSEVSRSYFGNDETDYSKRFSDIRDYYKRMENADRITADEYKNKILAGVAPEQSKEKLDFYNARIQNAQYQQWQAQECMNIYQKGHDLRMLAGKERFRLEHSLRWIVQDIEQDLEFAKSDVEDYNKLLKENNETINMLSYRNKLYQELSALPTEINNKLKLQRTDEKSIYADLQLSLIPDEKNILQTRISELEGFIQKYTEQSDWYKTRIAEALEKLKTLPKELIDAKNAVATSERKISNIRGQLIPLFDELKHFYAKQRIKG